MTFPPEAWACKVGGELSTATNHRWAPCDGVAVQVTLYAPAAATSFVATTTSTSQLESNWESIVTKPLLGVAVTEAAPESPAQIATRVAGPAVVTFRLVWGGLRTLLNCAS